MIFDVHYAYAILPVLLRASVITIEATITSFLVALVIGLALVLARGAKVPLVRWSAEGFVQFVRSTPLLMQLYFLYFVLPAWGITLSPFTTGVLGLGTHYSCYVSEVYRAGIESVPRGQLEAAVALNYRRFETFWRIVLPQAIPPIVPVLANYMIAMFKDTPILSAITVIELMQTAYVIASEKFLYVEPMTIVGLLFLVMSLLASLGVRGLEKALKR